MNEDEVIATGLKDIRKGITEGDWLAVCKGYNSISGEDLKPFKKISRLENIRSLINTPSQEQTNTEEKPPELPLISSTIENKQKGGNRFGQGQITIISSDIIPEELEENKRTAKPRRIVKRDTEITILEKAGLRTENEPSRRAITEDDDDED